MRLLWVMIASAALLTGCDNDGSAPRSSTLPTAPTTVSVSSRVGAARPTPDRSPKALASMTNSASTENVEMIDPFDALNPVELGEPLDADALPWEISAATVELGDPLDAAPLPDGFVEETGAERVELGEPLDADAVPWEIPAEPVELGEPLDADLLPDGVVEETGAARVELGQPLDADDPVSWR